ncbi:hypothetical protein CONCODRAFT_2009 [Conidiobolus coronatus NRRL 28638]|uniref:Apple domain-containing protein n=1 Tax=Conidiobolus coronatus (strain ATCC 28846 / CBS 209.66 / NRRL 28638) TaxID=796925 RepID=A0A137PIV6_CONC2|nr:hypothetical protein CONCODRAFT_2009 [Conidiobolus coronatus NRRL 28638]|eukprot:KXN74934.1 hypothetical protein CONCODRAFT_2009 [Conidiobolus coronatus NRRL 28638]
MELNFILVFFIAFVSASSTECDKSIGLIENYTTLNVNGKVSSIVCSNVCKYTGCTKRLSNPYSSITGNKCSQGSSTPIANGYANYYYCSDTTTFNDFTQLLDNGDWNCVDNKESRYT